MPNNKFNCQENAATLNGKMNESNRWMKHTISWPQILRISFIKDSAALRTLEDLSFSKKGVLRGLHRQIMFPQAKLVRVVQGLIYDVAVDIRKGSPTYGKAYGTLLCGPMDPEAKDYNLAFYIPENFLHGFLVLSDNVVFWYKVNDYYHSNDEGGIIWNDPDLNIEWPLEKYGLTVDDIILSDKDKNAKRFSEVL